MSNTQSRRRYTREFKLEAIQLVANWDGKVTKVAESLGLHPNILHRWIKEHEDDATHSFPGNGKLKTPDEEIRQLKNQLREAEELRDILKKALSIFSKKKPWPISSFTISSSSFRSSTYVGYLASAEVPITTG